MCHQPSLPLASFFCDNTVSVVAKASVPSSKETRPSMA